MKKHIVAIFLISILLTETTFSKTCIDWFSEAGINTSLVESSTSVDTIKGPNSSELADLGILVDPKSEDFLSVFIGRYPEVYDSLKGLYSSRPSNSLLSSRYFLKIVERGLIESPGSVAQFVYETLSLELRVAHRNYRPTSEVLKQLGVKSKSFMKFRDQWIQFLNSAPASQSVFVAFFNMHWEKMSNLFFEGVSYPLDNFFFDEWVYAINENGSPSDVLKIAASDGQGQVSLQDRYEQNRGSYETSQLAKRVGCLYGICVGSEVIWHRPEDQREEYESPSKQLMVVAINYKRKLFVLRERLPSRNRGYYQDSDSDYEKYIAPVGQLQGVGFKVEHSREASNIFHNLSLKKRIFLKQIRWVSYLTGRLKEIKPDQQNRVELAESAVKALPSTQESPGEIPKLSSASTFAEMGEFSSYWVGRYAQVLDQLSTSIENSSQIDRSFVEYVIALDSQMKAGSKPGLSDFLKNVASRNQFRALVLDQFSKVESQASQYIQDIQGAISRLELLEMNDDKLQTFLSQRISEMEGLKEEAEKTLGQLRSAQGRLLAEDEIFKDIRAAIESSDFKPETQTLVQQLLRLVNRAN